MKDATILKTGIAGAVIAALCCATPALVILLGAVGLSAWLSWIDYGVLPALVIFLALTAHALWRQKRSATCRVPQTQTNEETR